MRRFRPVGLGFAVFFARLIAVSAILGFGLSAINVHAGTNSWTATFDDFWDDASSWSLGAAPSISDSADVITNASGTVVSLDSTDTLFYTNTMTISNLVVAGFGSTVNTLFLDGTGFVVPFHVLNGATISSGGSLVVTGSYFDVSGGGQLTINGTVLESNAFVVVPRVMLVGATNAPASLTVDAGTMYVTNGVQGGLLEVQNAILAFGNGPDYAGPNYIDNLLLTNGAVLEFALGSNSVPVQVLSNLTLSGTLDILDGGGITPGTYRLFNYGGSLANKGLAIGSIPANFHYTLSTTAPGQVNVVVSSGTSTTPVFQVTSIVRQGNNIVLTWTEAGGTSNTVQAASGSVTGNYSNNFADISSLITNGYLTIVTNTFSDVGGATNVPARFYRVSLAPGNAAADNANNPPYTNGWNNSSNGGYGFSPWVQATSSNSAAVNGFFVGSSTNNGGHATPGIDVNGKSWGAYANTGNLSVGYRAFANGSMRIGQTFLINIDNGYVNSGSTVGFVLRNGNVTSSAGTYTNGARLVFEYIGFDPNGVYRILDAGGTENSGVSYTPTGLLLQFTLTGTNTYSLLTIDNKTGANYTFSGTLAGSGTVDSLAVFNNNAGSGGDYDFFCNSLQLTGLPSQ